MDLYFGFILWIYTLVHLNNADICKRKLGSTGEEVSDDTVFHTSPLESLIVIFKLSLGLNLIVCTVLSPSILTKADS